VAAVAMIERREIIIRKRRRANMIGIKERISFSGASPNAASIITPPVR